MTSISEIKDRLEAVAFAGRSYPGAKRSDLERAYKKALEEIEDHAVGDLEYLIRRIGEMRAAIVVAAVELSDAAGDIAGITRRTMRKWRRSGLLSASRWTSS